MTMMTDAAGQHLAHNHAHNLDDTTRLEAMILVTTLLALVGLGFAVWTWGLVALTLTAVAAVPVMFILIIKITLG